MDNDEAVTSVPLGYKHTDIGVIPQDWNLSKLKDLAEIRSGIAKNSNALVVNPILVHYLRVANVQDGYLDLSEMSQLLISREDVKRYAVLPGDMLMNEGGDIDKLGRGTLWNGEFNPCVHQNHVFVVRCGSRLSVRFLNSWTSAATARRYFLLAGRQTTNLASINKTSLGRLPIAMPSTKVEQEAIAEALSDADALIESLEQLLVKKRHIKQGAMQDLLTGKQRLPGFSGEWASKHWGDVMVSCSSGATPWRGRSDFYHGSVKWITSGELNHCVIMDTNEHISEEAVRKTNLQLHPVGTFLMAITGLEAAGTRGACGIVGSPATTNQSCMAIYPTADLDTLFLFYYYELCGDELALRYCQGTKQQSYTAKLVKILPISLPPTIEEQTAIATILSDMDAEIALLEAQLSKARQIKQGMMQELLTGRIRLVQPETVKSSNVVALSEPQTNKPVADKPHNQQIEEAAILGALTAMFGTERYPLARVRRTKLMYLLQRHLGQKTDAYLKKAAGPYNPGTRYKGPESIAVKNGYVLVQHNGTYEGFVPGGQVSQARAYVEKWHGADALAWLEQFRKKKTDELELLATVDKAMQELLAAAKSVTMSRVKQLIHDHPEWLPKLEREIFTDANLERAIRECRELFA